MVSGRGIGRSKYLDEIRCSDNAPVRKRFDRVCAITDVWKIFGGPAVLSCYLQEGLEGWQRCFVAEAWISSGPRCLKGHLLRFSTSLP